jgi:alkanesulfonate monooxygenase SsuD/methylene tetrahydromethanopterin reductase-like flavin-dependent oxidoreductase (luciferase family)
MVECTRLAEARNFAATWVAEGRRGDVFALLTALALNTSRIRLGAGILPVLVRSPWVVATGTAIVDEISGQRFMLGLGAGHKNVIEDRHGFSYDRPTQKMKEVTEIVRRALTGNIVNFDGETFNIRNAQLSRQPVRKDVPIYIAGIGSRVLELGGEVADGVFLIFPTERSIQSALNRVREGAERANRDPTRVDVVSYVFTCMSTDKQAAIESSRRTIAYFGRLSHYRSLFIREGFIEEAEALKEAWERNDTTRATQAVTDKMVSALSASGTADDIIAGIGALLSAGLKQAVIFPVAAEGCAKQAIIETIEALSQ